MVARVAVLLMSALLIALSPSFGQSSRRHSLDTPEYTFEIIRQFPHDPAAFTQGFAYHDGYFYEGTGLNGRSSVRQVRIETGRVVRRTDLAAQFFGEGIAVVKNKIIQLTWQSHIGFVYRLEDLRFLRSFAYSGEGWGLTTNGHELFMSDGSSQLRILDPDTFIEKRRVGVHEGKTLVSQLNELEFVDGEIFANVWYSDRIARISPRTGEITGWIDLSGLRSAASTAGAEAVLNGIAYDPQRKRLFVTGKLWPAIYEIRLKPKP
ncbi:MAG: glutaminyl-peptide cyclotransferase [Acidobacteria bacterium]|nr:glutaminyl-peptide cyclotransferase [Acidobacteriota bacterium]MBV9622636.1 glutaminyl-peptide cyclotransferase [Acidobacteriota bacterium]